MIHDLILEKIQSDPVKNIWGRYNHHYGWSWNKEVSKPTIYPTSPEGVSMVSAVIMRDWAISQKLEKLGVKRVLDVGSDTGHLLATLTAHSIEAVGVDSSKQACSYIEERGVNSCYNIAIQDLIKLSTLGNDYDCLICLNITHAKWENEKLKTEFINWIRKNFTYTVLSDMTHQDKDWEGFELIHQFNIGRFKYNKILQLIYRALGIDPIIHYTGIQKLYKIKK